MVTLLFDHEKATPVGKVFVQAFPGVKDFFEGIGKFGDFQVASDYELNLRATAQKPIVLFHRDLFWWRQHDGQEILNSNKNNEYIIFNYKIHKTLANYSIEECLKRKILKNNEILMARRLLKLLFKGGFRKAIKIIKLTDFPVKHFIIGLIPTKNYF